MLEPGPHCCRTSGRPVVGIDEVGRGCLAGHVTAAAVWFPTLDVPQGVDDSKKVRENRRDAIAEAIHASAVVAIAHASVAEIDDMGIHRACHLAMVRAWKALEAPRDALVIVDGDVAPEGLGPHAVAMTAADARCPTVAAASIVAKVDRDRAMREMAGDGDPYGWLRNKGYGTPIHMTALRIHGAGPHHRTSFAPVRRAIAARSSA